MTASREVMISRLSSPSTRARWQTIGISTFVTGGRYMRLTSRLIASSLLALLTASEAWAQTVYVRNAPPAPRAEIRTRSPGPGWVWQPGYYRWRRGAYSWRPGIWVRPPARHAMWVPPRWHHSRRGWHSSPGYWRTRRW